jgi:hypothetical protein
MTDTLQHARNATLKNLVDLLKRQDATKQDIVTPLSAITSRNGTFTIDGTAVFGEGMQFVPTAIADGHVSAKLGIPLAYLRTLREQRPDLYDANVNGWISGAGVADPDDRSVLLRTFMADDSDEPGVLRALLSDRYGIIDNFDVLTAALAGIKETGTPIEVLGADLTESKMTVRIAAPEVVANFPGMLEGYRNPFGQDGVYDHSGGGARFHRTVPQWARDRFGVNEQGVCAGLVITNSETGGGSFAIIPRLLTLVCLNGAMIARDALRRVHVGGRLEEGAITWSKDTERKALELITSKAKDAVQAFLDPAYLEMTMHDLEQKAKHPLDNPAEAVEFVAKQLAYTEDERDGVLDFFIKGGQVTAGGVMQAVTAYAQTVEDAEAAFALEESAVEALELAYAAA